MEQMVSKDSSSSAISLPKFKGFLYGIVAQNIPFHVYQSCVLFASETLNPCFLAFSGTLSICQLKNQSAANNHCPTFTIAEKEPEGLGEVREKKLGLGQRITPGIAGHCFPSNQKIRLELTANVSCHMANGKLEREVAGARPPICQLSSFLRASRGNFLASSILCLRRPHRVKDPSS